MSDKVAQARKIRVFLVDDHPVMRRGVADCIDEQPDLAVCGQAGSAAEAVPAIAGARPDVVVTDLSLPGRDGLELIKDLKARDREVRVLVLSMHDESLYAERVLRAGAYGYVMKSAPPEELLEAIRRVSSGDIVVGPQVIKRVLARSMWGETGGQPASSVQGLSDRELEVFRLLGQGLERREIAARLQLSVKTVEAHRVNIRQKLGVSTAAELRQRAMEFLREEAAGNPRS